MSHRLHLLDAPHVQVAKTRIELSPSRPMYLLICLAYYGAWINRETLATLLWTDSLEDEARHNLRVTFHRAKAQTWATDLTVERTRA